MSDEIPDWIASLDQITAGFKDLAAILHSYYEHLIGIGFSEDQALNIVIAFQAAGIADGGGFE